MVLIFGGAYQGKLKYAQEKFNVADSDVCDLKISDLDLSKKIIRHFEMVCRKDIPFDISDLEDKIIILNDESCGLVPISDGDRSYREKLGRLSVKLGKEAKEVYRVFVGFGDRIK